MTTFDFSPIYRSAIGFEHLASLLSNASRVDYGQSYPPYNIEATSEDDYRITIAVAGFSEKEIDITSEQNKLTVSGNRATQKEDSEYLYRGIAERAFERRYQLADYVRVTGARLENGLLHIELKRELPEAMKPQSIKIKAGKSNFIEGKLGKKKDAA